MSFQDILADSWNIMRAAAGLGTARPTSILDYALADGPLDIRRIEDARSMPSGFLRWDGPIPAVPVPPPVAVKVPEPDLVLSAPRLQASSNRLQPLSKRL